MSIIQLKEANCKSCYKCVRNCEVKSISFKSDQARIIDDDCVLCGKCTLICPQNAKEIKSDLGKVRKAVAAGVPLYVSVAPSYVAAFSGVSFPALWAGLKQLGFAGAEETAVGAQNVSREYAKLMQAGEMHNIITTCCPTVNLLVEKYYPDLKPYLAPVVAPATAHARMLKKAHPEAKVVFVGPCISKKYEAESGDDIFAVLLFEELANWFVSEGIRLHSGSNQAPGMQETITRLYPVPSGIIKTIPRESRLKYRCTAVDGLNRCMEMLTSLREHPEIQGYFIEMSACANSCVAGPGLQYKKTPTLISRGAINATLEDAAPGAMGTEGIQVPMFHAYAETWVREPLPDEETIRGILASIGKTDEAGMLNCGACGYPSCRDKAIAVAQGKAELHMCLPYMREKAESLSNVIIDATPNALILLDENDNILQYNHAAQLLYGIKREMGVGFPAELYIPGVDFASVRGGEMIEEERLSIREGERVALQTILSAPNNDILIVARDVTDQEHANREIEALRRETLAITQAVIDKQMRVAQEIASLLGETTGESKAALISLKKSILKGESL